MLLTRRNALRSLFFAAPAIVAAPSLMRVSTAYWTGAVEDWKFPELYEFKERLWYAGYETIPEMNWIAFAKAPNAQTWTIIDIAEQRLVTKG